MDSVLGLQHWMKKDPALERRFQPVRVPEATVDETIQILIGLREQYEIHHKLRYTDEALVAAAHISYQYISFLRRLESLRKNSDRLRRRRMKLFVVKTLGRLVNYVIEKWILRLRFQL